MDRPIDPAVFEQAAMREALACHDIGTVYRLLKHAGVPQRRIAELTGQSQSQVSEIMHGRRVQGYEVLERVADGLGVPRGVMGLSYGARGAYAVDEKGQLPAMPGAEVTEEMKRRAFLLAAGAAVVNSPALGELLLNIPSSNESASLPSRVVRSDVAALRDLTEQMRLVARQYGGQADVIGGMADRAVRLLAVPGTDVVKAQLGSALAELHTEAGYCCFDSGLHTEARDYFDRALRIAGQAADAYQMSYVVRHAGIAMSEQGAPNDGLKLFQLGQVKLGELPRDDPSSAALGAWMHLESAVAFARMNRPDDAQHELAKAREGWQPPDTFDAADMDHGAAWVNTELGNLDTAESFARSSLATWSDTNDRRDAVKAEINLAFIHLQAQEPGGLELSRRAITTADGLRSRRARERLAPLVDALASRRDSQSQELAVAARRVATSRA